MRQAHNYKNDVMYEYMKSKVMVSIIFQPNQVINGFHFHVSFTGL